MLGGLIAIGAATVIATAGGAAPVARPTAAQVAAPVAPAVTTFRDPVIGRVLSDRGRLALYYWNAERDGRVRCRGECARVWPPLIVRRGTTVSARVAGIPGRFGTVRRPDGRLQLTHNRRPLYTYHDDPRGRARCDNVNGWFAIRAPRPT